MSRTGFHIDTGARCDEHATDESSESPNHHFGQLPTMIAPADKYGYCTIHRDYPSTPALPCLRCVEESREAL